MSRRRWLKNAFIAGAAGAVGLGLYVERIEPHWVEVVRRSMPIDNLPSSLIGKKLVQISDIHIGDRVDSNYLIAWFKRIASWQPDFVVFTGDFLTIQGDGSPPMEKIKKVLEEFPRGNLGTIGILGNHDYGMYWRDRQVAADMQKVAESAGIQILRNQTQMVGDLQIVGFDDFWGPNFGGSRVLKNVDHQKPTLVLCHNPDVVDLPVWHDYRGWILSGHTHGGQCKLPYWRPPLLPTNNPMYSAGEFALQDGRHLYINRALGHSFKVRFNVRPEITVFELEGAAS